MTDNELKELKSMALRAEVLDAPNDDQAVINGEFFVEAIAAVPMLVDEVLSYRDLQRRRLGVGGG